MKNSQLIFIPSPGPSHLNSTVETAKLLLNKNDHLSITIIVLSFNRDRTGHDKSQKITSNFATTSRLQIIDLPEQDEASPSASVFDLCAKKFPLVRDIVRNLINQSQVENFQVAGLVLDMFCTKFNDLGDEFGIPSYLFFTSAACTLGLIYSLVSLRFEHGQKFSGYKNSDAELSVPCFPIPVPAKVLPAEFVSEDSSALFDNFRRFREAKGIMVNTFYDLESYAIDSLCDGKTPKVYPVGPILQTDCNGSQYDDIKKWLDGQPESSVVFLCFGSGGSFDETQVKEIAFGLEKSGHRFLWSLRKSGAKGTTFQSPTEFQDFQEVLPEGFLERTNGVGKVIGWAPQVAVLSHVAVGGFMSHCGWNSILESLWCGVPVATFPLYAEQQLNAFKLVKELELAEEIRVDYHKNMTGDSGEVEIVGSGEIDAAIRRLMAEDGVRQKVKEMQKKSQMALMEGGSSYNALNLFIEDVINNVA